MKSHDESASVAMALSQIRQQLVKICTLLTGILVTLIVLCGVALNPILGPQLTLDTGIGVSILMFGIYILAIFGGGIMSLAATIVNRKVAMTQQDERMKAL